MSTDKNKNKGQQQEENQLVKVGNDKGAIMRGEVDNDALLDAAADEKNAGLFEDAGADYLQLSEGQETTLFLDGFSTMKNDKGEDIEVATFTGKENKKFIHAGSTVVSQAKRVAEKAGLPAIVRLKHQGMKKSSNNGQKYADINVRYLRPAPAQA